MRLQPIFGIYQRDGKNNNGLTMFKCLVCGHRTSWYKREHRHSDKYTIKMKPRTLGATNKIV